ncbi:MAG: VWA domain-containing protein [Acidobacteriota bacterium]
MLRRFIPPAALIFLAAFLLGAQQPDIRVEVERVNILVTVTDKNGRFITGIERDRFKVFEDGKAQTITNFDNPTDLPIQLALMLDTSGSVRTQLDFEKEAARRFIHSILLPQDQALLASFDRGLSLLHDYTNRPADIAREIDDLVAGGGTALLDAIRRVTLEKMSFGIDRKVIVLVSDGLDRDSETSKKDVLRVLQTHGVALYCIGTNRFTADQKKEGWDLMEDLAEKTGGQAFFPYAVERLEESFEQVNQELRSQYLIAYSPTRTERDGTFRKFRVKIKKGGGFRIRHRQGYYAPPANAEGGGL